MSAPAPNGRFEQYISERMAEMRKDITELQHSLAELVRKEAGHEAVSLWKRRFIGTAIAAGALAVAVITLVIRAVS